MELTEKQKSRLLEKVKKNGGRVGLAAGELDIDYKSAHDFIKSVRVSLPKLPMREELRKFIIATREAMNPFWPPEAQEAILTARHNYDAGIIDMAQYRQGDNIHLLVYPRKFPDRTRRKYFSRVMVEL